MKSKHLDKLRELYIAENKRKYPSIPDHCRAVPKFSDKTANGLEKAIVAFLKLSGHQAERIKNMGRMLDNTKAYTDTMGVSRTIGSRQYIKGTGTNGTSDVSSTIQLEIGGKKFGLSVKWEIKMKDKQSDAQKKYQVEIEESGGIYHIVRSFDEFYDKYLLIINTN